MRPNLIPLAAAVLTVAPTWSAGTVAQESQSPLPGVFGEVLDVRVVNLEVTVTDKNGIPIAGLKPEDFTLVVDGESVPIEYFSEVLGGVAVAEGAGSAPGLPGVPQVAPGGRVETSYLVFIDEFFSIAGDRNRVLDSLREQLPLLGPEDRMAVVAYDGRDLSMLTSWSQSVDALERVFRRARERPTAGLQRLSERRQAKLDESVAVQSILSEAFASQGVRTGIDRTFLEPQERYYVQRLAEQLDRSVAAAAATLRSFAKPPGRKVLLLLSGGWPYFPVEYLYSDFDRVILDREGLAGDDLYGRLIDTANLLGYTIYPVDVPGLDREAVDVSVFEPSADQGFNNRSFQRERENHLTLERIAQETGGKALLNARRIGALGEVVSDTRSYYWMGFSPDRAWNDERHEVEIRTSNPDFRVRTRAGFLDSSRQREVSMAVESSLLFGNQPGASSLTVELGSARKAGRRRMEVPLTVLLPLTDLTFLPVGEGFASQVELRIAVIDEDGYRADIPVVAMTLQSAVEPDSRTVGRHQTSLVLRRKAHEAVVSVYDAASGRIFSTKVEIEEPRNL